MPQAVDERVAVSRRQRLSGGGPLGPDRDNLAVILSLAGFVEAGLGGAPADVLKRRLINLLDATDAAIDLGALPELVRPTFDNLVERVLVAADNRSAEASDHFAKAVSSMEQDAEELPSSAESHSVSGADGRSVVERIWDSLSPRMAK
ncbi:hypothetical protein J2847_004107 [Azospirillum agricola]|uniref:hypothetical protein n=1 Tax=Azospirillum agricola TaxID=1720247 RepID=UPI001AE8466C|nr:hypothetical protein [Azospirillum agricola]MBP2230798.1 hypothetical protein [Azospirillum agricola]